MTTIALAALLCAMVPAVMFCVNLLLYREPAKMGTADLPRVSVLIPARNEAAGIAECVRSVLASTGVQLDVVVMDDGSTDGTGAIVQTIALTDSRVRLGDAPPLPRGWNGKQHACYSLAAVARYDVLCFVDADVRLAPEAVARMAGFLHTSRSALVSGFPRQITGTWLERLLLPLIHFVLLGFLPITRMRSSTDPAFAAGCGQFAMVDRAAYQASGGHAAIRATMHDGLLLPKLLREHGYRTDLADLTELATSRMYSTAAQVWSGLAKNATEGLAAPVRIVPISIVLFLGQVVPFLILPGLVVSRGWTSEAAAIALGAVCAALLPRLLGVARFRQSGLGAVLHPFGVVVLLAVQWFALTRKIMGGSVSWKSRAYVGE